jgi:hypothetical protein
MVSVSGNEIYRTAKYAWQDYKTSEGILSELKIVVVRNIQEG